MSEEQIPGVECTDVGEVITVQEPIIHLTENGVEGFEVLCRLCANRSDHLIPIYSEEGVSNDLAEKMNLYLPFKVTKTDLLPLQCCFQCASTVLTWHELYIASVEADRRLREIQTEVEKQLAEHNVEIESEPGPSHIETENKSDEDSNVCELSSNILYINNILHENIEIEISNIENTNNENNPEELENLFLCELCSTLCEDEEALQMHLLTHSNIIKTENIMLKQELPDKFDETCDISELVLAEDDEEVSTLIHEELFEKNDSGNEFDDLNDTYKLIECEMCLKQFKRVSNLNTHIVNHIRDYPCYVCCNSYITQFKLDHHLLSHSEEELSIRKDDPAVVICPYNCNEQFYSKFLLYEHKKMHKNIVDYVCVECNKKFKSMQVLQTHKKQHNANAVCKICGKRYSTQRSLKEHLNLHSNIKKYKCPVCNIQFRFKSAFKMHETVHNGKREYTCGQCNKSFARPNYLKEHMRIHFNERPFRCDFCESSFTQKNVLKTHIANKHRYCKFCNESIGDALQLRMHMWRNHPQENPEVVNFENREYLVEPIVEIAEETDTKIEKS